MLVGSEGKNLYLHSSNVADKKKIYLKLSNI